MVTEFRAALHATSVVGVVMAAAMLVPAGIDLAYGDENWLDFTVSAFLTGLFWLLIATTTRGQITTFNARFGILLVNLLWFVLPVTLIMPFVFGPAKLSIVDAIFETASGLTTTGSTVMTGLDDQDKGTLVWRSLLQWMGGVGILSVVLIVLPALNVGGLQLFRLESSDRSDKVMPRFASIVKSIVFVYVGLTIACAAAFTIAGMSAFDAVNHAMTALSTGGFSTHDRSIGHYDGDAVLWVGSVFMLLAGLPFTFFIALLFGRGRTRRDPQVIWYFAIVALASAILLLGRTHGTSHTARAVAEDVFDVISIITTTGFAAGDYTTWESLAAPLFFLLTFFGGCSGSTAGGLKIYRLVVLFQMIRAAVRELIHPHGVFPMRYGDRVVDPEIFKSALVMTVAFSGITGLCLLLLGAQGNDLVTALSGTVTALANVGPGLGPIIGPAGTFQPLSDPTKLTLAAAMIIGRLEIMVVLALFVPALWR